MSSATVKQPNNASQNPSHRSTSLSVIQNVGSDIGRVEIKSDYAVDDRFWSTFKLKLREQAPHITEEQIGWAEQLVQKARDYMASLQGFLPPTQAWPAMPDDEDSDGELKIEWNIRHKHHLSFEVHRSGLVSWVYLDYQTQHGESDVWDLHQVDEIPARAKAFLALLKS